MKTLVEVKIVTIMLIIASLCTGALFSGCVGDDVSADYEPARRAAVTAWEELIGPVSDKCYNRMVDAIVSENDVFPESCLVPDGIDLGGTIVGCYLPTKVDSISDDIIFIYSDRQMILKMDTGIHEFIHELDYCADGGGPLDMVTIDECAAELMWNLEPGYKCADIPGDYFHLDKRLWDRYGPNTVEALGCANLGL